MLHAVVVNDVVVNMVVWDGESLWTPEEGQAIKADGPVGIGFRYVSGRFLPPLPVPLTPEEARAEAVNQRQLLLFAAESAISSLRERLLLGTISEEEKTRLIKWQDYAGLVKNININAAPDINWPEKPE